MASEGHAAFTLLMPGAVECGAPTLAEARPTSERRVKAGRNGGSLHDTVLLLP